VAIENTANLAGERQIRDPVEILATTDILEKIEAVCKRHFYAENDQNEAYIFVLDSLKDDNFRRLRAYKGKSKLSTYLHTLINSLVIDFRRKRYGRRRIPATVLKLGRWAEAVYRLVCWQRFSFDDAYDFLRIDGLFEGSYDQFMQEIEPIRNAPCRENPTFKSIDERTRDPIRDMEATGANPLESLIQKFDRDRRIKALGVIRETTQKLPEKDQLLVRLVFGSEQSLQAAAKVIELSTSAARRRLKGLLIKYRERLLAVGIREP
jgi:RNA polymerase sigma factor (sigma-70 family)